MPAASLQEHFAGLTDPQRRPVTDPLINVVSSDNVVVIALCGAGADGVLTYFAVEAAKLLA